MAVSISDAGGGNVVIVGDAGTNSTLLVNISGSSLLLGLTGETWVDGGGAAAMGWNGVGGGGATAICDYTLVASLTIDLGDGTNVLNIRAVKCPITFSPTGGTNTVNISSNAPSNTGNILAIEADITISPQAGATVALVLSDQAATSGNADVQIGSGAVTGIMGPSDEYALNYSTAGGGTFTTFNIIGSANAAVAETFTVSEMPQCSTSFRITANSGTNTINLLVASTPYIITGGTGVDTVIAGTAAGSVSGLDGFTNAPTLNTISLSGASNVIRWDDTGSASGNKTYIITPGASAAASASLACSSFATQAWAASGGTYAGGLRFDGSSVGGNTFVVAANFQDNAIIAGNGSGNILNLSALTGWTDNGTDTITLSNAKTITYSGMAAVTLQNTVAPAVTPTGAQPIGTTFTTDNGTWTGGGSPTYGYQWEKNDGIGPGWSNVTEVTSDADTITPDAALVGQYLRCAVTATNGAGSATAESNAVGPVEAVASGSTRVPRIRLGLGMGL